MRISRTPEYRGGSGSPLLLILVLLIVLVVGGVAIYFLLGNNSTQETAAPVAPAMEVPPTLPRPSVQNTQNSLTPAVSAQTLPTPMPQSPPDAGAAPQVSGPLYTPPEVTFGEVLDEGFVDLQLLSGQIRTWYTFQVDTSTNNTVLFFAFYDAGGQNISRTIMVENYIRSEIIKNAQLTVFYPDAPERTIIFDREAGTILSRRFYNAQPFDPSLFSTQMRVALIQQGLALQNNTGQFQAEMQVDLTGTTAQEGIALLETNQTVTHNALNEIQMVIDQLESRRGSR